MMRREYPGISSICLKLFGLFICCVLSAGCMSGVKRNVVATSQASAIVGSISHGTIQPSLVVVAALFEENGLIRPINYTHLNHDGRYVMRLETRKKYRIAAFVDKHGTLQYEPGVATAITDQEIYTGEEAGMVEVNLSLQTDTRVSATVEAALQGLGAVRQKPLPVVTGEVSSLTDPRLSAKQGERGLWQPFEFVTDVGVGIYFLEPFDPDRIPVLFVNGAGGSPQDWKFIVQRLDTSRYQPWVYVYPSGARLEKSAETLQALLTSVQQRIRFKRLYLVAHSMGGLVSRGALRQYFKEHSEPFINGFISISTPWRGHEAARLGVDLAPATVPTWIDMVPDSEYQLSIFENRIDTCLSYYLLFGYRGGAAIFSDYNDGTVTLQSQLFQKAQDEAVKIYGFHEDHVSILSSDQVVQRLHRILAELDSKLVEP